MNFIFNCKRYYKKCIMIISQTYSHNIRSIHKWKIFTLMKYMRIFKLSNRLLMILMRISRLLLIKLLMKILSFLIRHLRKIGPILGSFVINWSSRRIWLGRLWVIRRAGWWKWWESLRMAWWDCGRKRKVRRKIRKEWKIKGKEKG